jgi:hypothetical protein
LVVNPWWNAWILAGIVLEHWCILDICHNCDMREGCADVLVLLFSNWYGLSLLQISVELIVFEIPVVNLPCPRKNPVT